MSLSFTYICRLVRNRTQQKKICTYTVTLYSPCNTTAYVVTVGAVC